MNSSSNDGLSPKHITWLRNLVTLLTAVMILGMITIGTLMYVKLGQSSAPIAQLPAGVNQSDVLSYSWTPEYIIITTRENIIKIYDRTGKTLVQEHPLP